MLYYFCPVDYEPFYPRSPCGERHRISKAHGRTPALSIHALLAESDPPLICHRLGDAGFLSTLSLRRATSKIIILVWGLELSIHALLAESDYDRNTRHSFF